MIYLWNMAMWRITWGYIPVVLISHWFYPSSVTWHCTIPERVIEVSWLAKTNNGGFSRPWVPEGSSFPVLSTWKCSSSVHSVDIIYVTRVFSEVTSSEKNIFHRFFTLVMWQLTIEVTLHQLFSLQQKWRYLHHSFTISFFRGFGSKSHFTSQPILYIPPEIPGLVNCHITNWKNPPYFSWENPLFRLGHLIIFNSELLTSPDITIFNGKIHYKWPFSIAILT